MYKSDFPFFENNPDLLYLDSAATALKPKSVIERIHRYMTSESAPVGRGLYATSIAATEAVEEARNYAKSWIDADSGHVIFTSGATDALNILANGIQFEEGDEIILSESEHHANLVPWQQATKHGARIIFIHHDALGRLDINQLKEALSEKTKVLSLSLVSNVFGTILPVGDILSLFGQGIRPYFILDASQAAPHLPLSVRTLGCDALVFAGHKVYGPEGIGVLWGNTPFLESLAPMRTGGGMIEKVTPAASSFTALPSRLEAGSPNTMGILGLHAALTYLDTIGRDSIKRHTVSVAEQFHYALSEIPEITILGEPDKESGIISFTHASIHPHDVAEFLASKDICVRAGHQCAQPLHSALGIMGSVRVSIGLYNEPQDAERFAETLKEAITFFSHA